MLSGSRALAKTATSCILGHVMANATETATSTKPFAVIATGGKQYHVSVGDTVLVELLSDSKEGDTITFDTVLLHDDGATTKVGTPHVAGATVTATHLGEVKGKKLSIIRFKAKSNRSRKLGHRQQYAKVQIESIG